MENDIKKGMGQVQIFPEIALYFPCFSSPIHLPLLSVLKLYVRPAALDTAKSCSNLKSFVFI